MKVILPAKINQFIPKFKKCSNLLKLLFFSFLLVIGILLTMYIFGSGIYMESDKCPENYARYYDSYKDASYCINKNGAKIPAILTLIASDATNPEQTISEYLKKIKRLPSKNRDAALLKYDLNYIIVKDEYKKPQRIYLNKLRKHNNLYYAYLNGNFGVYEDKVVRDDRPNDTFFLFVVPKRNKSKVYSLELVWPKKKLVWQKQKNYKYLSVQHFVDYLNLNPQKKHNNPNELYSDYSETLIEHYILLERGVDFYTFNDLNFSKELNGRCMNRDVYYGTIDFTSEEYQSQGNPCYNHFQIYKFFKRPNVSIEEALEKFTSGKIIDDSKNLAYLDFVEKFPKGYKILRVKDSFDKKLNLEESFYLYYNKYPDRFYYIVPEKNYFNPIGKLRTIEGNFWPTTIRIKDSPNFFERNKLIYDSLGVKDPYKVTPELFDIEIESSRTSEDLTKTVISISWDLDLTKGNVYKYPSSYRYDDLKAGQYNPKRLIVKKVLKRRSKVSPEILEEVSKEYKTFFDINEYPELIKFTSPEYVKSKNQGDDSGAYLIGSGKQRDTIIA